VILRGNGLLNTEHVVSSRGTVDDHEIIVPTILIRSTMGTSEAQQSNEQAARNPVTLGIAAFAAILGGYFSMQPFFDAPLFIHPGASILVFLLVRHSCWDSMVTPSGSPPSLVSSSRPASASGFPTRRFNRYSGFLGRLLLRATRFQSRYSCSSSGRL